MNVNRAEHDQSALSSALVHTRLPTRPIRSYCIVDLDFPSSWLVVSLVNVSRDRHYSTFVLFKKKNERSIPVFIHPLLNGREILRFLLILSTRVLALSTGDCCAIAFNDCASPPIDTDSRRLTESTEK